MATDLQIVGTPARKVDAAKLATGRGTFTDDVFVRDLLHARILTSPHAHARIVAIDTNKAAALPGVHAAISHKDIKRIPYTTAGQSWPEPSPYDMYILDNKVRFVGDYVAAVAAETPEIAADALNLINVTYEVLPAVLDMHNSMSRGAPVIHDEPESHGMYDAGRNLAAHIEVEVGNVAEGLTDADLVVSEDYFVQYQQHTCLEPHVSIAWVDEDGRLVIRTSTQIPYHCRRMVAFALDIPVRDVHVLKPRVGGGFGNKQEVVTEPLAAVLAIKTGRPVKLEYSRRDEFTIARMRHPQHLTVSIGAKRDGSLTATHIKVLSNTGPYGTHALTVTGNTGSKTLPLYRSPNIRFDADIVYTNLPISGAFRGYGAPQGFFALEVAIDEMACRLGRDPLEFRRQNVIRKGDTDPVSAALAEGSAKQARVMHSNGLPECLDRGSAAIGWAETRRGGAVLSSCEGPLVRGVGMCCLMQGSGVAGDELAAATIKMNEDASFTLMLGSADIGTGSDTTLAMIAAEVLGVPLDKILVYSGDTDHVTFDYGAYASSTAYITGQSVLKAADEARRQIADIAGRMLQEDPEGLLVRDGKVSSLSGHSVSLQEIIMESLYGEEKTLIQGRGTHATKESPPPFVAMFVEVEVDIELGTVRPIHVATAIDVGKALNPAICEGQVEGAVTQALGYALTEEIVVSNEGRVLNPSFMDYKIFCADDMPKLTTILVEDPEPTGPFGAKSVAEVAINGPAPAIANAIFDAIGVRLRSLPMSAEKVLKGLGRL
ncbi:MAG TPA: molybdopterin cofactor-binding domain-containing protein [Chloroflexota bacterium]|jgi:putative selenate reductase molybdopterin-binding subunit|nr:molybdopterin cofactor-binding domain-containing protein [Chloroflexota bacterium]